MRTVLGLLPILWAGLLVAQPGAGQKVIGGPFVVNAGQRSATVVWVVQTGQVSVSAAGQPAKTAPVLRSEKIVLTGLQPGTVYQYDSFGGEAGKGSFKTAPKGAAQFEFVVYGDNRTR